MCGSTTIKEISKSTKKEDAVRRCTKGYDCKFTAREKLKHIVSKEAFNMDGIGKKLDFYSQEMLREINTLSSKAMIAEIKNEAVELKSHIEKMKEHAQNVE